MRGRYGRLPSMQALIGFESAARLQSFSRAAEELHMTQSAISHQVRGLEDQLGQTLFRRRGRQVDLTDAGRDLLETTRRTLNALTTGVNRLDFYVKSGSVVVGCPPGWARHWLLPRLPKLRRELPDIDPWLFTSQDEIDLEHTECDFVVALGDGHWPGKQVLRLGSELLSPVCSPEYAKQLGRRPSLAKVPRCELLHDEDWGGWNRWFIAAELPIPAPVRGINYSEPGLLLDSALSGHGLALASLTLAEEALSSGALVQP
ncbi:MAG: LysR family transcriptional regulator, partial [Pseudomonadota bacterium]